MTDRTLRIITETTSGGKAGIDSLNASLAQTGKTAPVAATGIKGMVGGLTSMVNPAALATAGVAAVGAAIVTSVNAARDGRAVQAQLAAVLTSTGHAAGVSQAELNKHAEALQKVTNFDDEATGSAQALLLTFTQIGGQTIPRATKAVLDMSVAMKQDLQSSSVQIGKALNDPIKGITALTRVGVTFTDEQKNMIKSMVAANDVAGAQAVILAELEKEFGGSAEAAREADGGFIALGNSVGNLAEAFGSIIMNINDGTSAMSGLISVVDTATSSVNEIADAFSLGLPQGMLTMVDNSSLLLQGLEELGIDVIPDFTVALNAAREAQEAAGAASAAAAEQLAAQEEATASLAEATRTGLVEMAKLDEQYNEKKKSLEEDKLKAMSASAESQAENYRAMNEKLNEIDLNRGTQTDEQIATKKAKVIASYNEENVQIKASLDERQRAIDAQIAKEKAQHEEKAAEIKRLMALQVLEQSGQLEELTGIAGITAQQYMDAVAAGAISANKEVETQAAQTEKTFEGAQKRTADIVRQNQALIAKLHGETSNSITQTSSRTTSAVVSDFERQANAAYKANMAMRGTVTANTTKRNTDFGAGFAQGGAFKVPPGYPNDSFPMRVSSGEMVTVIPASQAGAGQGFAKGTSGIPAGFKPDGEGNYVHNSYQPGYVWNGSRYVPPKSSSFSGARTQSASTTAAWAAYNSRKAKPIAAHLRSSGGSSPSLSSSSPSMSAAPVSPMSSAGGTAPFTIHIDYHPTVSLASQYELEQALDPAVRNLLRKFGVAVSG